MADEYETIGPRASRTAEALLVAAERTGFEPWVVRTAITGYVVPKKVADEYRRMAAGETEPVETEAIETVQNSETAEGDYPNSTWKNADIEAWAEAHEVDLGGATKKADMLAAIQAADTKEG